MKSYKDLITIYVSCLPSIVLSYLKRWSSSAKRGNKIMGSPVLFFILIWLHESFGKFSIFYLYRLNLSTFSNSMINWNKKSNYFKILESKNPLSLVLYDLVSCLSQYINLSEPCKWSFVNCYWFFHYFKSGLSMQIIKHFFRITISNCPC